SDQFDPVAGNNQASATETPQQADLALTKAVSPARPNVGDTITFTITLTDLGPDPATTVRVTDLLPVGLTLLSANPSRGTYTAAPGLWEVAASPPSAAQSLTHTAPADSPTPSLHAALPTCSDQFDPVGSNNPASVTETPQRADLALTKTVNTPRPNVGDTVT